MRCNEQNSQYSCKQNIFHLLDLFFSRLCKPNSQSTIENIVQQLVKLYNKSDNTGMSFRYLLIQSIYMEIRDEKNWEDIAEVANFAPLMTEKQAKILALLIKLEQAPTEVHEKQQTPTLIIDELLRFIRYSIFGKDGGGLPRMQTFKISQLANLTRLFMALVRFKGKGNQTDLRLVILKKQIYYSQIIFNII